jgi:hypothetical protein
MTKNEFTRIYTVAKRVREGIINDWSRAIPGTCGAAARDIKRICDEEYGLELELIVGRFTGFDHTWCEFDGFVIDVTVDQFSGILPEIVIVKVCDWDAYERQTADTPKAHKGGSRRWTIA